MMGIKMLCTALFLALIFGNSQCYEYDINRKLESLAENYAKWVQKTWTPDMFAFHGHTLLPLSDLQPPVSDVSESAVQYTSNAHHSLIKDLVSECTLDLIHVITSLKSEEWPIRMLDSDGKPPSDILGGNVKWPGSYKECIKVYAPPPKANSSLGNFHGRYCTATWQLNVGNFPLPLSVGVCVPDSCDGRQIKLNTENILYILERFPILKKLENVLNLTDVSCKPLEVKLDGPAIGMICLLSVFGFLMLAGSSITVFEYFVPSKKKNVPVPNGPFSIQSHPGVVASDSMNANHVIINKSIEGDQNETDDKLILLNSDPEEETHLKRGKIFVTSFLKSFCIFTNGAKILNTDVTEGQLLCIHGIRFLSMAWVILGHSYVFGALNGFANLSDIVEEIDTWEFQVILQGTFSVDTFFLLSGLLLTYLFLKEADKSEGKISWPFFYIHRYWRLTPVYMIVLGFETAVARYFGSGPFWPDSGFDPACRKGWWRNLLYINNFGDSTQQCFAWAWYLANDMQFYVISPLFLYALWRWPKVGLSIVCSLLLSSWITSGIITTEDNLISSYSEITIVTNLQEYTARMLDYFWKMYVKPYTRIGPYLIGVLVGYVLYKTGNKKNFLEAWSQLLGWSIATALTLLVIFGVYDTKLSTTSAGVFNALSRSTFAIGVAWVIYACLTGHADAVNKILSWKMFIPLSRLTYCAYLVHPIVIGGFYQSLQQPVYFSHFTVVIFFFGFLVLSYMVALITSLAFESPLMGIEKLLLKKR